MGNNIPGSYSNLEEKLRRNDKLCNKNEFILMLMNQTKNKKTNGMSKSFCVDSLAPSSPSKSIRKSKLNTSSTGFSLKSKMMTNYDSIQKGKSIGDTTKIMKFIINLEPNEYREEIIISEPFELTCGWLLSQVTRQYENYLNKRKESLTIMDTEAGSRTS